MILGSLLLAALLACSPQDEVARHDTESAAAPATAFVGATVLAMDGTPDAADQTVLVRGDRIVAVGSQDAIEIPPDAVIIESAGRFVMPGLVDMHAHVDHPSELSLYPAYGVTTVLNMRGLPKHLVWRDEIAAGTRFGPTLYTTGDYLDGDPPTMRPMTSVSTPEDAAAMVRDQHAAGYDMIKVYARLTPEQLEAIVDQANAIGMAVVGHSSGNYSLEQLAEIGQAMVAHGESVQQRMTSPPTDAEIESVVTAFREAGVAVIPNLNFSRALVRQKTNLDSILAQPEARVLHPAIFQPFRRANNRYARRDDAWLARVRSQVTQLDRLTAALAKGGVTLMVGTDASTAGAYPGYSVYEDLEALVDTGLTPSEALEAATATPGRFIAKHVRPRPDPDSAQPSAQAIRFGQVAPGFRADLILLEQNPRDGVRHVRDPLGVMLRGAWHPRSALDDRLEALAVSHEEIADDVIAIEQHILRGEIDSARARFDATRAERPDAVLFSQYVPFFVGYGFLYGDDGFDDDPDRLKVALGLYAMYAETYPEFHSAHFMLAEARRATGDLDGARTALETTLSLHPNHPEARTRLADLDRGSRP